MKKGSSWRGSRIGKNNPNWKGDGRKSRRQIGREWYLKHKDDPVFKQKAREYREKNKERLSLMKTLWKQRNPILNIWSNAKYRARRIGLEFNLEPSDIIIPKICPYLGIRLTSKKMRGHLDSHLSLDRIDSSKGYIKGNVEVISYRANAMKQNASKKQLIIFANSVLKRFL